jgi:hypothetical protein
MLGDRLPFTIHKQKTVTILIDLHIITSADPSPVFGLLQTIRVKPARAKRSA